MPKVIRKQRTISPLQQKIEKLNAFWSLKKTTLLAKIEVLVVKKNSFIQGLPSRKESIKQKILGKYKAANYQFRLRRFRFRARGEYFFTRYVITYRTWSVVYFLFLFLLSLKLGAFLDVVALKGVVISYFVQAGAMIGGILAIVFSLNLFLMQNAAENFSSGFYKVIGRDKLQDCIFFFIALCVVLFFSASLFTKDYHILLFGHNFSLGSASLQVSTFLIGLILYLIFHMYQRVFNRMQPEAAISIARDSSISKLDKLSKRVKEAATTLASNPSDNQPASVSEYQASLYQQMSPITYLNDRLSYLFDYHDKLIAKNEKTLAMRVLDSVSDILKKYFSIRSESSLQIPTEQIFATVSDSQTLLTPNLERLIFVGATYARNFDNKGVSKTIHIMKSLSMAAIHIKYIAGRRSDNPIYEQCTGYLGQLVTSIIELKSDEGVFQAAIAYGQLGQDAIQNKYRIELISIYDKFDALTQYSVARRFEPGLSEIFDSYKNIIAELIISKWNVEHELDHLFEHLDNTTILSFLLVSAGNLHDRHFTQTTIAKPYVHLKDLIIRIPYEVEHADDEDVQREWIGTFLEAAESLRRSLRKISENIHNADHMLIWSFGIIIQEVGVLMLELTTLPKWSDHRSELIRLVGWYLFQPQFFTGGAVTIESNNNYDQLIEAVTRIGLKAAELGITQTEEDAIKVLQGFALEMLTKQAPTASEDTEPEIMLRASLIGILALKLNQTAIVEFLKNKIQEFQPQYEAKWFTNVPPAYEAAHPRNVLKTKIEEMMTNRRSSVTRVIMDEDSESVLSALIVNADIQAFIDYIWPNTGV